MGLHSRKKTGCDLDGTFFDPDIPVVPLVVCVHAVTVSGHFLQFPVPALHPPGAIVALLDQHLRESTFRLNKCLFLFHTGWPHYFLDDLLL